MELVLMLIVQNCLVLTILDSNLCAMRKKQTTRYFRIGKISGIHQGGFPFLILYIDIGFMVQQQANYIFVFHRINQGSIAITIAFIYISSILNQQACAII